MPDRPNILWFMTDEQRADSLRVGGAPWAVSPHLDALAARGTRFAADDGVMLHNLADDPGERRNLAGDPAQEGRIAAMIEAIDRRDAGLSGAAGASTG